MPAMPFILPSVHRATVQPKFFQTIPLIVEVEPGLNVNSVSGEIADKLKLQIGKTISSMNMFSVEIPTAMLVDLAAIDKIQSISLNREHYAFNFPQIPKNIIPSRLKKVLGREDGIIPTSQANKKVNIDVLHGMGIKGSGVKVAVLDTGVDLAHPQIQGNVTKLSTMKVQPTGEDENGHGHWCITDIKGAEKQDPLTGLVAEGGAPGCDMTSIKVLGLGIGTGMTADIMEAIEIAVNGGNKVISMSLGSEGSNDEEMDPMVRMINDYAILHPDVLIVVANGNSGPDPITVGIPACSEKCIAVGSWGIIDSAPAYFSSRGPTQQSKRIRPDIMGCGGGRKESALKPKENIWSGTALGSILDPASDQLYNGWTAIAGTSMATPQVAAILALWKEIFPDLTATMVKKIFKDLSGQRKNNDDGYGLIDATWILSAGEAPRKIRNKSDSNISTTTKTAPVF